MIPLGAKIRPSRMTCPWLSLPVPSSSLPPSPLCSVIRRRLVIYPRTGCKNTFRLGSIPTLVPGGSALASTDRLSLFIRKGINKRRRGTVYGARSDDKIRPCKSAGYLTGRWTIFEYLPPHSFSSLLHFLGPVIRSLGSPAILARSFAPAVLYYFMLAEQSFLFVSFIF